MSRVLLVDPGLKLWGSERALLASISGLKQVHEALVALVPYGAELKAELAALDVKVIEGPIGLLNRKGPAARALTVLWLLAICVINRVDLLYLNQAGLCRIGHVVARILRMRMVIHIRLMSDIARCAQLEPSVTAPIDVVTISRDVTARFEAARTGRRNLRVAFSYDVCDVTPLPNCVERDVSAIACLGRIEPSKGQIEFIRAASLTSAKYPALRADIIGDVADQAYGHLVQDAVRNSSHVTLLGYRRDAASLLSGYSFLAAPTRYETLGRVILEAWNAGCVPLCSTDSGGAAEIVSLSGGGLLYKGFESTALAQAMCEALTMSARQRAECVKRGRAWMSANTSLASYRTRLAGVLFPEI